MEKPKIKRKGIRFSPEPGTLAEFTYLGLDEKFKAQYAGLVISESSTGCSLVHTGAPLKVGDEITIKVGSLAPVASEVRWVIQLDEKIQKAGFQFLL
jgi:hypothetical protein